MTSHSDVSTTEASSPVTAINGPEISSVPSIMTAGGTIYGYFASIELDSRSVIAYYG